MNFVMAFDPGKETGWARLSGDSFSSGEQPLEQVLHFVYESLKQGFQMEIICEDFIYTSQTSKKTRQTWSTEGIGVLRFLAREYDCPFTLQQPSSAKRFSTNEKLKKTGWYKPGMDHANDAARHLMVWAVENGRLDIRSFM